MPPRPNSHSPEPHDQANRGQHWNAESAGNASPSSPDQRAPPAYSTLSPPYSPTNAKDKEDAEEQLVDIQGKEDQLPVTATTLPSPRMHKASIPSPQTSSYTAVIFRRSFVLREDSCLDFRTPCPSLPRGPIQKGSPSVLV